MFALDIPTLKLAGLTIVFGTLMALFAFWHNRQLRKYSSSWVTGIVAYSVSFVVVTLWSVDTPYWLNICNDLLLIGSSLLLYQGYRETYCLSSMRLLYVSVLGITLLEGIFFKYVYDSLEIRLAYVSAVISIISFMSAWVIARSLRFNFSALEMVSALLFYLYGSLNFSKVFYIWFGNFDLDTLMVMFLAGCVFISGLTFTFILVSYSKAEEELVQLLEKVRSDSVAKMESVQARWLQGLEYAKAGTWELDIKKQMMTFSSQWCRMRGIRYEERVMSIAEYLAQIHPDDMYQVQYEFDKLEKGEITAFANEHRVRCRDDSWIWVSSRGHIVHDIDDQDRTLLLGTDIDITENKITQSKLELAISEARQAKEIAVRANKAKSSFLANVSHEIRTPMNAIMGFSQLMMEDRSLTEEQKENLEVINSSGLHLLTLIDDILNLSRIESGEFEVQNVEVETHELFREIASYFTKRPIKVGVDFECIISDKLPDTIEADQKGIRQVCINLLSNAFKFTERGKVLFKVDAAQRSETEAVLIIEVRDTGIGMSADEKEHIFNAFEQIRFSKSSVSEGYGLGLSICKNIINLLGGKIEVNTAVGQGSTFSVKLPVGLLKAGGRLSSKAVIDTISPLRLESFSVLIVDDIESNRKLLRRLLLDSGLQIQEASTADEALLMMLEQKPDLVLMDIRMPGKSGDEAIIEIRNTPALAEVPVVAVTANAMQGEKERLIEIGATNFISKPFMKDEVYRKIADALDIPVTRINAQARLADSSLNVEHKKPAQDTDKNSSKSGLPSILVVDDNGANLQLLTTQLMTMGLKADTAVNGEVGLDLWQENHYEIVFADCAMPGMDGFDMTRNIRFLEAQDAAWRENPTLVIAITGSPEEYHDQCVAAGMDEILGKPLLLNTLVGTLGRLRPELNLSA